MKKIGLICLAVVLTLGIGGVGFGWWSETLDIGQNPVNTGNLDAIFRQAVSNDDGSVCPRFCIDGYWLANVDTGDDGGDPEACQAMGVAVDRTANVASTAVTGAHPLGSQSTFTIGDTPYKQLTVTMTNVYPCYYATIFFNILNAGTIPAKVKSIKLVEISKGGTVITLGSPRVLVPCETWFIDVDGPRVEKTSSPGDDFSIHLSDDKDTLYDVMGTPFQAIDTAAGDLCIHVEEGAEENTTYDFTVEIAVVPFNG